jgi:paraquat-inducible protein B
LADSVNATSEAAHATLDDIDHLARAGTRQLVVTGDQLGHVLVSAERTVRQVETLVTSLQDASAPNSRLRGDLQAAIRDLAASASSLRGFTHQIERNPSTILLGKAAK